MFLLETLWFLPLLIFLSRIIDVGLGTIRVLFISKGYKVIAPLIGFVEISVWLLAARQIFGDLGNWLSILAYALGFSAGTFVGIVIEERLRLGKVVVRVIARDKNDEMLSELNKIGKAVTVTDGEGPRGKVKIIFTVIRKEELESVIDVIKRTNPQAFYTIADVRYANERNPVQKRLPNIFGFYRKAK